MGRARDDHFEEFQPHSLLKQAILEAYCGRWVYKLSLGRSVQELVLVDAFAGPGADHAGNAGSPLRIARAARAGRAHLAEIRGPVQVKTLLLEKRDDYRDQLRSRMDGFGDSVEVLPGTLDEELDGILARFPETPVFFFLDPFGVDGLDGDQIRRALAGPMREVLALVDDDGMMRLVRAIAVRESRRAKRCREEKQVLHLFEDNEKRAAELDAEAEASQRQLVRTGERAKHHLSRLFTPDELLTLLGEGDTDVVRERVLDLFEQKLQEWGAPYTTRIPICSENGQRQYTLLHASQNRHGRSTMKEEVYRVLRSDGTSPDIASAVAQACRVPTEAVVARIIEAYAGREAGWSAKDPASIRTFALQETPVFPWQLDDVERLLTERGFRLPGRAKRFAFPASLAAS